MDLNNSDWYINRTDINKHQNIIFNTNKFKNIDEWHKSELLRIFPKAQGFICRPICVWKEYLNLSNDKPIKYLEVGTLHGSSIISVAKTFGSHNDSELHCIDPWIDYKEYEEYKNKQDKNYNIFIENITNAEVKNKIYIHREFSHIELLKLDNNYFDIIYLDGNHEPHYVLEDAVYAFRKLKINGYLIFDDYGWGGPDMTMKGINSFLNGYHKRIKVLGLVNFQMYVQKLN